MNLPDEMFHCAMHISNASPTALKEEIKRMLPMNGFSIQKESSLENDGTTILHITGNRLSDQYPTENNRQFFKQTLCQLQTPQFTLDGQPGYQLPGSDLVFNQGQSIYAALQECGINFIMQCDMFGWSDWWKKALSPQRVNRLKNIFNVAFLLYAVWIGFYLGMAALSWYGDLRLDKYTEIFVLILVCQQYVIILQYLIQFKWPTLMNIIMASGHFILALAITVGQYYTEKFTGNDYLPSFFYECCRISLMQILTSNKSQHMITRVNSIKKHLRLPMFAYLLLDYDTFHQEAFRQMFCWRITGSVLELIGLFLEPYAKQLFCRCWCCQSALDHQDDDDITLLDDNHPLVKRNRRTILLQDYNVEGWFIDLFLTCAFASVMTYQKPVLLVWAFLRLSCEVPVNYIKVFYIYKQTIAL